MNNHNLDGNVFTVRSEADLDDLLYKNKFQLTVIILQDKLDRTARILKSCIKHLLGPKYIVGKKAVFVYVDLNSFSVIDTEQKYTQGLKNAMLPVALFMCNNSSLGAIQRVNCDNRCQYLVETTDRFVQLIQEKVQDNGGNTGENQVNQVTNPVNQEQNPVSTS
jgi:hypothetical protein